MDAAEDPCGNPADDHLRRDILRNDSPGRHDGVVADPHAAEDRSVRADPDVAPQRDGCRAGRRTLLGFEAVVERREDPVVADMAAVAESYAPGVLKMDAGVEAEPADKVDVRTGVGLQGREGTEWRVVSAE